MLTPAFELIQDEVYLTIIIRAPFTKISETEIFIEECDFKFYSKPYFLRLNLPGNIVEDGRESADYDAEKGTFTIRVPKQTPGEKFEGLDMLTKLLAPKGQRSAAQPIIEVMGEPSVCPSEQLDGSEVDWSVEQTIDAQTESLHINGYKYGFGSLRSDVFSKLQGELQEVIDVKDPDSLSFQERTLQRTTQEDTKFDDDHYLADLYQDDLIQDVMTFDPPWNKHWKKMQSGGKADEIILEEAEKEKIRKLPNKEYLIDSCQLPSVYFSLVDIIFAYAYTYRTTEGETNVESGWSVCKLSSTLSWLEVFSGLRDTLVACYRRSLCFPLYRHWDLVQLVKRDTCMILSLGRCQVLKCLLDIRDILTDTDQRYVLNDLYINDYCVWIQGVANENLTKLSDDLMKIKISKSDVGFSLVELEAAAQATLEEEEAGGIVGKLKRMMVAGQPDQDSDDSSDDEEQEDESSESDDDRTSSEDERTDSSITRAVDSHSVEDKTKVEYVSDKNSASCSDNADTTINALNVSTINAEGKVEDVKLKASQIATPELGVGEADSLKKDSHDNLDRPVEIVDKVYSCGPPTTEFEKISVKDANVQDIFVHQNK